MEKAALSSGLNMRIAVLGITCGSGALGSVYILAVSLMPWLGRHRSGLYLDASRLYALKVMTSPIRNKTPSRILNKVEPRSRNLADRARQQTSGTDQGAGRTNRTMSRAPSSRASTDCVPVRLPDPPRTSGPRRDSRPAESARRRGAAERAGTPSQPSP